jgi:hypothetical protein
MAFLSASAFKAFRNDSSSFSITAFASVNASFSSVLAALSFACNSAFSFSRLAISLCSTFSVLSVASSTDLSVFSFHTFSRSLISFSNSLSRTCLTISANPDSSTLNTLLQFGHLISFI